MKTQHFFLYFGFLSFLTWGCAHDEISDRVASGGGGDIRFEIGFTPQSRVSTGTDFRSAWEVGDQIGLYAAPHGEPLGAEGNFIHNAKLTFDGTSWNPETPLYWPGATIKLDFYAYYPFVETATDPTAIPLSLAIYQHTQASHNRSDVLFARSDNADEGWARGSTVTLGFNHAAAMVELTIDNTSKLLDATHEITLAAHNLTTGTMRMNLNTSTYVDDPTPSYVSLFHVDQPGEPDKLIFRAFVLPQGFSSVSISFEISIDGVHESSLDITRTVTESFSGEAECFTYTLSPSDGIISPESNCYMLEPDGGAIYIPVSRANAAVDPASNLGAVADGLGGVTADNFTAELVWSDLAVGEGGVVKTLEARRFGEKGYVYVKPGAIGNAVVCAKVNGVVKWSWHIWVTDEVGSGTDSDTGLTWMDRNLGAAGNTYMTGGRNGLYYQWGRKDAFPGSNGKNENQVYVTPDHPSGTTGHPSTDDYTTLTNLVENPLILTKSGSYLGSVSEVGSENESWGAVSGSKTIYDPCPVGWKVPPIAVNGTNSWGSSIDWSSFSGNGRSFTKSEFTHFYPAIGYRNPTSSYYPIILVGTNGYYWSADPSGNLASNLYFSSSSITPSSTLTRYYATAVRCVKE